MQMALKSLNSLEAAIHVCTLIQMDFDDGYNNIKKGEQRHSLWLVKCWTLDENEGAHKLQRYI